MNGANRVIFQTASHAVLQVAVSSMQGGSFQSGMASGLFGSLSAGGSDGSVGAAAFVGGMSSKENGGSFWQGASQAGIVAAFNHGMHEGADSYDPYDLSDPRNNPMAAVIAMSGLYETLGLGTLSRSISGGIKYLIGKFGSQ